MQQTSGTNPTGAPTEQAPDDGQPASSQPAEQSAVEQSGFRSRGRARRRARFLRRARELAYRDLGGLVYNLHRFGQRNDPLVLAKLNTLGLIDAELRTIESTLAERRPITVLREAGITACPRCAAIHGSEDRYCPNCGLPMSRHADLPITGAPAGAPPAGDGAASPPQPPQTVAAPAAPAQAAVAPGPAPAMPAAPGPATQRHSISPPAPAPSAGRTPSPPARPSPVESAAGTTSGSRPEETTEIIRPQGAGS